MSCKKKWSHEFVDEQFSYAWRNKELKAYREDVMFQTELALLPDTQPSVERMIIQRKKSKELFELREQKKLIIERIRDLMMGGGFIITKEEIENKRYVRACPTDDCRGFLDGKFVCGMCDTKVCKDCYEILEDDHECKPENIETANLLKKDSKPCPVCASMTIKISGCNNVFCRTCKTNFNWVTLKVEKAAHNPDFYDYLRENGMVIQRAAGDIPENECGLPNIMEINRKLQDLLNKNKIDLKLKDEIMEVHRVMMHTQNIELHRFPANDYNNDTNKDLRIKYMMNEISQEDLKTLLQAREKKRIKYQAIHEILSTFITVSSEHLRELMRTNFKKSDILVFEKLVKYANENLAKIATRFKCKVPTIYINPRAEVRLAMI